MKKFDPTKPVQTRDGRPARIIATNVIERLPSTGWRLDHETILARIEGFPDPLYFHEDGSYVRGADDGNDLVNVVERHEKVAYVNLGQSYSVLDGAQRASPGWPVLKVTLKVADNGLEDATAEVISAEVLEGMGG